VSLYRCFIAVASCNDLANFASHRVSSLARKRDTQLAHPCGIKARIFRLIEQRVVDRPQVPLLGEFLADGMCGFGSWLRLH